NVGYGPYSMAHPHFRHVFGDGELLPLTMIDGNNWEFPVTGVTTVPFIWPPRGTGMFEDGYPVQDSAGRHWLVNGTGETVVNFDAGTLRLNYTATRVLQVPDGGPAAGMLALA